MLEEYADVIAKIENAEEVIDDEEKFRKKLRIGADAYQSLKVTSKLGPIAAGAAGAAAASSPIVASTLFGGSAATVAGWLGLGLAATTPVGWVIAAGVATGGAYMAYGKFRSKLVDEVPRQINAPLDVLATSVIAFLLPIVFRLALADGNVDDQERRKIKDFFVNEWGYSKSYIDGRIGKLENETDPVSLDELFSKLEELKNHDKDCNFDQIFRELLHFLEDLANSDGEFHPGEIATIDAVKVRLDRHGLLPS